MKNRFLHIIVLAVLATGLFLFYGMKKQGFFIDEIFTFGLSNSHYTPFVCDIKDGNLNDKILTSQELLDYIEVHEDRFDAGSVYYNQTCDVHPPLYYWIMNFASSLFPYSHSKWIMLSVNFIFFLLILLCLYYLSLRVFNERKYVILACLLYMFSILGLSTLLMVRMYILLTLLTLVLAILVWDIINNEEKWYTYVLMSIVIMLGMLTQYYFVFFAFFVSAVVVIYAFRCKMYKKATIYALSAIVGVTLMIAIYPAVIDHMFRNTLVSGKQVASNAVNLKVCAVNFAKFGKQLLMKAAVLCVFFAIYLFVAVRNHKSLRQTLCEANLKGLLLIIPAVLTLIVVFTISPAITLRYIYNIVPILILSIVWLIYVLEKSVINQKLLLASVCVLLIANICYTFVVKPDYLCINHSYFNEIAQSHSNASCVYVGDNPSQAITADLIQLLNFDEIFVTDNVNSEKLSEYLAQKNSEELVLYIVTDNVWCIGFDSETVLKDLADNTEYATPVQLYSSGLSSTYKMTRRQ